MLMWGLHFILEMIHDEVMSIILKIRCKNPISRIIGSCTISSPEAISFRHKRVHVCYVYVHTCVHIHVAHVHSLVTKQYSNFCPKVGILRAWFIDEKLIITPWLWVRSTQRPWGDDQLFINEQERPCKG